MQLMWPEQQEKGITAEGLEHITGEKSGPSCKRSHTRQVIDPVLGRKQRLV